MIVDRGRSRLRNQGESGIQADIDLCQVAKLRGREDQRSVHAFFRVFLKNGKEIRSGYF
jgi:hypothetical protein